MSNKQFPIEMRQKNYQLIIQTYKGKRVPVIFFFDKDKKWKSLKQYMLIVIEPECKFNDFRKVVKFKLRWSGYLAQKEDTLCFFINKFMLSEADRTIGDLYDQYKCQDGWLEINLATFSSF